MTLTINRVSDLLNDNEMIKKDFKDLIKQANFRRFIWWMLEESQPLVTQFNTDPYKTAYVSGKSDLGKQIMGLLLAEHPEKYKQMGDERKSILKIREEAKRDD